MSADAPHSSRRHSFRARPAHTLASRRVGTAAAAVALLIVLGCMSLSIGKFTSGVTDETGALCQTDEVTLPSGCDREVFYPVPYAGPPHLDVGNTPFNEIVLVEQKEDRFRVRNHSAFSKTMTWKARGVRTAGAPVVVVPPVPPPLPAPAEPPGQSP